jgi:hypothetical protein
VVRLHKANHLSADSVEAVQGTIAHNNHALSRKLIGHVSLGVPHPPLKGWQKLVSVSSREARGFPTPPCYCGQFGGVAVRPEEEPLDVSDSETWTPTGRAAGGTHAVGTRKAAHHHLVVEEVMDPEVGAAHAVHEVNRAVGAGWIQVVRAENALAVLD